MKRLFTVFALSSVLTGCLTPRGAGAGIGALIGAHEGGVGGAAIGALAGYGAGTLIEEHAEPHAYRTVYPPCRRCRPPERGYCLGH